ncbi:MAG: HU family DNA-binding protein [Flavobacteriaceae bacterium]|nr:HU family DNA-binding protein [Flavobacteriaceae bacterium]
MHKYKVIAKDNPQDKTAPVRYYGSPVSSGKVQIEEIAARISKESTLSRHDIIAVLSAFNDALAEYLQQGLSIDFERLGIFSLTFRSHGSDTPEEVNPSKFYAHRPSFRPKPNIRERLKQTKFVRDKSFPLPKPTKTKKK